MSLSGAVALDSADTRCRLCCCFRPSWGRWIAGKNAFMICYGFAGIVQGMLFMYYVGVSSTFESHFQLPSEAMGLIMAIGELVPIFSALFFSYFFGSGDRPRWLSLSLVLVGFGCHMIVFPYYIFGYEGQVQTVGNVSDHSNGGNGNGRLCESVPIGLTAADNFNATLGGNSSADVKECTVNAAQDNNVAAVTLCVIGYTVFNIGATLMYVVGTPYLDDNVQQKNSPIYLAISACIRTVGPMLGFVLSSVCLNVYVNPGESNGLTPTDARWIGAWWLGYVTMGSLGFVFAFIIGQFPTRLPSEGVTPAMQLEMADYAEKQQHLMATGKHKAVAKTSDIPPIKELLPSLRRLCTNMLLMSRIFSGVFTWFGVEGYVLYMPKYFEHQFSMTASQASVWTGYAVMIPILVGQLLVGLVLHHFQPRARRLAVAIGTTKLLYAAAIALLILLHCEGSQVYGSAFDAKYPACDVACSCGPTDFKPVCTYTGDTYFSPCHAGCSQEVFDNATQKLAFYDQCKCVSEGVVQPGQCMEPCDHTLTYVIISAIGQFLLSVEILGGLIFSLRCIDIKDKTLAMGLASSFFSILTFFPCPLVFAAMIDATCSVWAESCGEKGACLVYDLDQYRWLLHAVPAVLLLGGCVCDIVSWWKCKDLALFGEDEGVRGRKVSWTKPRTSNYT